MSQWDVIFEAWGGLISSDIIPHRGTRFYSPLRSHGQIRLSRFGFLHPLSWWLIGFRDPVIAGNVCLLFFGVLPPPLLCWCLHGVFGSRRTMARPLSVLKFWTGSQNKEAFVISSWEPETQIEVHHALPAVVFSSRPGENFRYIDVWNQNFNILPNSYVVSSDAISELRN